MTGIFAGLGSMVSAPKAGARPNLNTGITADSGTNTTGKPTGTVTTTGHPNRGS